jgi:hypothetical protein
MSQGVLGSARPRAYASPPVWTARGQRVITAADSVGERSGHEPLGVTSNAANSPGVWNGAEACRHDRRYRDDSQSETERGWTAAAVACSRSSTSVSMAIASRSREASASTVAFAS